MPDRKVSPTNDTSNPGGDNLSPGAQKRTRFFVPHPETDKLWFIALTMIRNALVIMSEVEQIQKNLRNEAEGSAHWMDKES